MRRGLKSYIHNHQTPFQVDNDTITTSIGHDDTTSWFVHGSNAGDYQSCSCRYSIIPEACERIFQLVDGSKLQRKENDMENALE